MVEFGEILVMWWTEMIFGLPHHRNGLVLSWHRADRQAGGMSAGVHVHFRRKAFEEQSTGIKRQVVQLGPSEAAKQPLAGLGRDNRWPTQLPSNPPDDRDGRRERLSLSAQKAPGPKTKDKGWAPIIGGQQSVRKVAQ